MSDSNSKPFKVTKDNKQLKARYDALFRDVLDRAESYRMKRLYFYMQTHPDKYDEEFIFKVVSTGKLVRMIAGTVAITRYDAKFRANNHTVQFCLMLHNSELTRHLNLDKLSCIKDAACVFELVKKKDLTAD